MQINQSLCNRSIDASALGVWFDALRGVSVDLRRFASGFVESGRGAIEIEPFYGMTAPIPRDLRAG